MGLPVAFSIYAECRISHSADGRVFESSVEIPARDVALVLGTSRKIGSNPNPYYEARLNAAAELFLKNKVRGIIVSGDNSTASYNEPSDMKNDLIARGVPAEFITCDYAGLRTLDSVRRASKVFGQNSLIIVSQPFHLERALFLANHSGVEALGYAAAEAPFVWRIRTRIREVFARDAAVFDVVFGRDAKHLGPSEAVKLAPSS
jgi:SanA protein